VLGRASAAEKVLTDLAGLARGSLALAASQTVASWLPLAIQRYRSRYPGIVVNLTIRRRRKPGPRRQRTLLSLPLGTTN
jgi:DNA-binding transcriptional LysR family regulator